MLSPRPPMAASWSIHLFQTNQKWLQFFNFDFAHQLGRWALSFRSAPQLFSLDSHQFPSLSTPFLRQSSAPVPSLWDFGRKSVGNTAQLRQLCCCLKIRWSPISAPPPCLAESPWLCFDYGRKRRNVASTRFYSFYPLIFPPFIFPCLEEKKIIQERNRMRQTHNCRGNVLVND